MYRRDKGRARGRSDAPCPLSISYLCSSVSSCSSLQTDRQSAGRTGLFLTVEVSQQPEPRGGRWEEAESPQLPHRTASLKPARGRSRPHQPMSTVGSVIFPFFYSETAGGLFIRIWIWILGSGDVSWHAAAGASFIGFVGCVVGAAGESISTPGLKMSPSKPRWWNSRCFGFYVVRLFQSKRGSCVRREHEVVAASDSRAAGQLEPQSAWSNGGYLAAVSAIETGSWDSRLQNDSIKKWQKKKRTWTWTSSRLFELDLEP